MPDRPLIHDGSLSPVTVDRIASFPAPGWQVPRMVRMSPDGALITYLQSESHGEQMALFAFDTKTREHRVLLRASDFPKKDAPLSREEELRRERQRTKIEGITSYAWAATAPVLLVPAGDRWIVKSGAGELKQLPAEGAIDPKLCADGSKIAFARGRELWLTDVASGEAKALTDGAPEGITRGQSDFNMQEEFYEPSGIFWSPSCDKLAYLEVDERQVGEVPILGFRNQAKPAGEQEYGVDLQSIRYPRTGGKNPIVRLAITDLAGKSVAVEMPASPQFDAADQYIGRFSWSPDGSALFFQRVSRDQKHIALIRVDAQSGKARALIEHGDPTWEMFTEQRALDDKRLLALWPKDGHVHLMVIDAHSGAPLKQLTQGEWDVLRISGIDASGRVLLLGNKDGVLDRLLYAVSADGGEIVKLSPEAGVHDIEGDHPEHGWVDIHSANDRPPQAVVYDPSGKVAGSIEVPRDPDFEQLKLRPAELVTLTPSVDQPPLHGALLLPRDYDPRLLYPAIVMVYGGPGVQTVLNEFNPRLLWQHLADRGFIVFQVDNRGSIGRGHGFDAPIHHRLGDIELEDQLHGLDYLAATTWVDPARIGIYGHSYGGYLALAAMLRAPGRFKVGVAGSPVTDWRFYDTGYTERYMGTPEQNPQGYHDTSLAPYAKNLSGKLLLIHALMDENVHFAHTAALIDAFVTHGKIFDMVVFPGERHGYRSPAARKYAYQRVIEYFVDNL